MARKAQTVGDGFFWTATSWIAALIAGGIFGYVFSDVYGAGRVGGIFLGGLVFIISGWILGRVNAPELPAPNTVKIDVPPAPTAPRSSGARAAAPSPSGGTAARDRSMSAESAGVAVGQFAGSVRTKVQEAVGSLSGGAQSVADRVKETVGSDDTTTTEGKKPATLDAPRDGGPDDLKKIKGIGPKIEELLHSLGYYHFDQIAAWTPEEIAWVDANLEGFNGRATRDDWVPQARLLSSGGETEFSKRVDEGDVY